jgi:hypothetical protein
MAPGTEYSILAIKCYHVNGECHTKGMNARTRLNEETRAGIQSALTQQANQASHKAVGYADLVAYHARRVRRVWRWMRTSLD